MRISKFAWLAAGLLAACGSSQEVSRNAPTRIELPDGLIVAGADGWCVDETTSRADGSASVVVLGSCAAIAGDALRPRPEVPGVVTVSVEAETGAVPDSETLETFFTSEAGRAVLARNGRAESVAILATQKAEGLLFLRASDASAAPGASKETWRALFGLGGRFVAISFYSRLEDSIDPEDGLATLIAHVEELRAANQG
jgi:hypothetical protein